MKKQAKKTLETTPFDRADAWAVQARDTDSEDDLLSAADAAQLSSPALAIAADVARFALPALNVDDALDIIRDVAPFRVVGYRRRAISSSWIARTTQTLVDDFADAWQDEYGLLSGSVSSAFPAGWRAHAVVAISQWVAEQAHAGTVQVFERDPVAEREYSAEEAEQLVRSVRPEWFERAETSPPNARETLIRWLEDHDVTQRKLCEALAVTEATVSGWLRGRRLPEPAYRDAIERWTSGDVAAMHWLDPEERKALRRLSLVEPYRGGTKHG